MAVQRQAEKTSSIGERNTPLALCLAAGQLESESGVQREGNPGSSEMSRRRLPVSVVASRSRTTPTQEKDTLRVDNRFQVLQEQNHRLFIIARADQDEAKWANQVLVEEIKKRKIPYSTSDKLKLGSNWIESATDVIYNSTIILVIISHEFKDCSEASELLSVAHYRSIKYRDFCRLVPVIITKDAAAIPQEIEHLTSIKCVENDPKAIITRLDDLLADPPCPPPSSGSKVTPKLQKRVRRSYSFKGPSLRRRRISNKRHPDNRTSEKKLNVNMKTKARQSRTVSRNESKKVFIVHDHTDDISVNFVNEKIIPILETNRITSYDKLAVTDHSDVNLDSQDLIDPTLELGKMLSNESDSIMDSCCGTIVVVPSQPGTLQSPLDKILFHSIEPRFESGNLQVLCVRLTQNSIVPVQLRGTATADYFNSEVSNMWPNLVAHFHEPVRMYHLSSSSAIFPEADVPEVPSLPLNYKFYARRLSVHRFLCGANKSIFIVPMLLLAIQFMVTVYKTYQAEDKWNISNFKFQDSPNLLCSSSAVTAVSFFLTVVQMTLTTGIPLLMIIKVMAMTTGMNSSLVLPFEHCDINAVWSILNKLYQPRELIDVNANNTIRQAERMIDKALFITVCQTVIHSFVLTLVLCLLGILYDLGHDSSTVVVVLGMVMDFLTGFIGLSCIGIGRALFACETKLCMYKDMWADTQDIPSGPFLQQWKIYEDTWYNCKKLAIGLIIILLMCLFVSNLLYYLCQNTSERESFESLPIMILRTSDFFAICPSGWFLANVSLPLDVLLFGLLIWHIQTQPEDYNVAGIYKYQQYHVNLLLWHLVLRVCFLVILDIGVCCYRGKWKQCQSYVSTAFQGIKMIAAIVLLWYI